MSRHTSTLLTLLAAIFVTTPLPASGKTIESANLVVSDATGSLSDQELARLADEAERTLQRVLKLWSTDPGLERFGKIRVAFDRPRREFYSSVFYWDTTAGTKVRVVRVHGFEGGPQMLAHKLTSAVFPNEDKLIRNAMGVAAESRVGSPLTFPMCGFSNDDWVLAFSRTKSLLPFEELGPDHASWGMDDAGQGKLLVTDKARQHVAYAEAGSFGNYLLDLFGPEKIKKLNRISHQRSRPFQEVLGTGLPELEADWLRTVRKGEESREDTLRLLVDLVKKNPGTACMEAQKLSATKR